MWERDLETGILGWRPPRDKETGRQPRYLASEEEPFPPVRIGEWSDDPVIAGVIERWNDVRAYFPEGGLPYAGGVYDSWPAVDADGFSICFGEEQAINDFVRYQRSNPG